MNIYRNKYPRGYYVYYYLRSQDSTQSHGAKKGSPYYVGRGIKGRAWNKLHTVKVPKDTSNIIIIAEGLTREQADKIEILHIALWGRLDVGTGILRNRTNGGGGANGFRHSPEECLRIGERSRQRKHSLEAKKKIGYANRMRVVSDDTKEKQRIAATGRKHTEETKSRLREIRKNQVFTEAHKKNMSLARKGKKLGPCSDATKEKLRQTALNKKIKILESQAKKAIPNATDEQIQEFINQALAPKVKAPRKSRGPHSEETKRKIGLANKGKSNPYKGIERSQDTKDKISKAHKGKTRGPRSRESILKGIATKIARYGKGG